jgi:broad specificity phosphatase PhoE
LWRCVQTAGYVGGNYHAPQPPSALNVKISDKWREWKGPGQLHVSDGRSTKTILNGRIRTLNGTVGAVQMKVDFEENFTDIDEGFHDPETFINVDIRVEHAFAQLFEGDANCRHIVTHGRTSQSLLRVLGFERKRREANLEDYRIWDFENAGTIVLLIRRQLRNDQCEQVKRDNKLQQEELQYINREYERDINDGFESIQQCAAKVSDKRDTWMAKLDMLQEEMQENKSVAWRYELLQKALNGTFRHGEFIVSYDHGFN